jgi:glycosyltransferase involved in cell wall biosynthesis
MRKEFARLYGEPPLFEMLPNPASEVIDVASEEKLRARHDLVGEFDGLVVGYLGGLDDRKGWRELVGGVAEATNCFLLFGGTGSQSFRDPRVEARCRTVGYVENLTGFLDACDVIAVPSKFDPDPLVVTEAAARGVPSITTRMVGTQEEVLRHGAGVPWDGAAETFPGVVRAVTDRLPHLAAGAKGMAEELSQGRIGARLRQCWIQSIDTQVRR